MPYKDDRMSKFYGPIVNNGIQSAKDHWEKKEDSTRAHAALDSVDNSLRKAREETEEEIRQQGRKPGES